MKPWILALTLTALEACANTVPPTQEPAATPATAAPAPQADAAPPPVPPEAPKNK